MSSRPETAREPAAEERAAKAFNVFRGHWAAEVQFYVEEASGSARYSSRFFDTLRAIAEARCSPS